MRPKMFKSRPARFIAFLATVGVAAALVGTAVQVTGAYFSDSKAGTITGTLGSIKVTTSGGSGADNLDFNFTNMLPGAPQTANGSYQNTGTSVEDVWIVFNNAPALHALNNLGTYGEVHLASNATSIFDSANLNDNLPPATGTCGPFSPSGCWPLAQEYKLASNLGPTASGTFAFTFNYAAKLKGAGAEGGAFNCYPIDSGTGACTSATNGLPYKIVATQPGVDPYNANNTSTP